MESFYVQKDQDAKNDEPFLSRVLSREIALLVHNSCTRHDFVTAIYNRVRETSFLSENGLEVTTCDLR